MCSVSIVESRRLIQNTMHSVMCTNNTTHYSSNKFIKLSCVIRAMFAMLLRVYQRHLGHPCTEIYKKYHISCIQFTRVNLNKHISPACALTHLDQIRSISFTFVTLNIEIPNCVEKNLCTKYFSLDLYCSLPTAHLFVHFIFHPFGIFQNLNKQINGKKKRRKMNRHNCVVTSDIAVY